LEQLEQFIDVPAAKNLGYRKAVYIAAIERLFIGGIDCLNRKILSIQNHHEVRKSFE